MFAEPLCLDGGILISGSACSHFSQFSFNTTWLNAHAFWRRPHPWFRLALGWLLAEERSSFVRSIIFANDALCYHRVWGWGVFINQVLLRETFFFHVTTFQKGLKTGTQCSGIWKSERHALRCSVSPPDGTPGLCFRGLMWFRKRGHRKFSGCPRTSSPAGTLRAPLRQRQQTTGASLTAGLLWASFSPSLCLLFVLLRR